MQLGKFITFEGGEGGGKSTQLSLLHKAVTAYGIDALKTREPGGTEGAEAIRNLLVSGSVDRWDPMTEMLLHTAARRDHVIKAIQPAIESGKWVICDRFIHSTLAYQAYGHKLGTTVVSMVQNLVIGRVFPCLVFILDIDPDKGVARANQRRGNENRYENMAGEFHKRVREGFLALAKKDPVRCMVIDATQPIASIHQQVIETVNARFGITLATSAI